MEARSTWSPTLATCVLENTFESRDNITVTMASDVVMLVIMLVGLLHSRQSTHGVVRHLYAQVGEAIFRPLVIEVKVLKYD
jgi:hypothetical protein